MTLTVHIERLVVDARVAGDAPALEAAVAAALAAQFAAGPTPAWWQGGGIVPQLTAALPARGPAAERIGSAVASALVAGPAADPVR